MWQVADWDPEVWIQDLNMSNVRRGSQIAVPASSPMLQPEFGLRDQPGRTKEGYYLPPSKCRGIQGPGDDPDCNINRWPSPPQKKNPISTMAFNLGGFLNNAGRVLTGQPMQFPGNQGGFVGPVAPTAVAPVPLASSFLPAVVRGAGRVVGRGRLSRGARTARDVVIGGVAGEIIGSGVDRAMSGGNGQVNGGVMTTAQKRSEILEWAAIYVGLKRVRARDLQKMAQLVGWDYTADYYGLSALEVGFVVANMPKRRRRGITAADVRRVRSTARKFDTLKRSLTGIGGTTRRRSYRSSSSKASASCR